jgi:hypothetical protein
VGGFNIFFAQELIEIIFQESIIMPNSVENPGELCYNCDLGWQTGNLSLKRRYVFVLALFMLMGIVQRPPI